jgi:hypothetical protein
MEDSVNSENFQKFFEWSQDFLKKNGKKFKTNNYRTIACDNKKCGGWCDGETLAVAGKNPKFEKTYCHEFAHMMQAIEEMPLWNERDDYFWNKERKKQNPFLSWKSILSLALLERDCEQRSLDLSAEWNLFDPVEYAKEANLYLFYYHFLWIHGKWINSTTIYQKELLYLMPETLASEKDLSCVNMDLMQEYKKYLLK